MYSRVIKMEDKKIVLSLEKRIENIERLVFGESEKDADYPKIVDSVHSISTQINVATAGRSRIEEIFRRLGELERFIDPVYVDELSITTSAKADLILADESDIRSKVEKLESFESTADVLNSEHIRAVPALKNRLQELCKVHLQQQDATVMVTDDVKRLIKLYNNAISLLSKQFVVCNELVTRLELAARHSTEFD